MFTESNELT